MTKTSLIAALSFFLAAGFTHGADVVDYSRETPAERDARMAWFRDARFGMFIHWGVYSVPAGEWEGKKNYGEWFQEETKMPVSQYEKFADSFNPVKFSARDWVRRAKEAGMRYIVITSKHHDGFGIYRSEMTDWCMKRTPFARDPLKELAQACQEADLKFCFYHSIMDWHHPDWGTRRKYNDLAPATPPDMDRYVTFMKGQLRELLTGYGPIGILWFDGEWESPWTNERGLDLYNYVRGFQPKIIINNRVGKGRSGMQGMDKGKGVGDYGTPEQEIPPTGFGPGVDWESCMTMNNHWGYNKHDQNWKSTETLVRNLIDCASKGGNYLLNIGPTAEGTFPEPSIVRLAEIGRWMKVNSESIYGTTASPFAKTPWGRATRKGTQLYLHVYNWPTSGILPLPLRNEIKSARLLADSAASVGIERSGETASLKLPATAPDQIASVVMIEMNGEPDVVQVLPGQKEDGSLTLTAEDAKIVGHSAKIEHKGGKANIGYWVDKGDSVKWTAKITRSGTFKVEAAYALAASSKGSKIQFGVGGSQIEAELSVTGGWDKFQTLPLGELVVEKTGTVEFSLLATAKPGEGVMNLRQVVLRPKP